MKFILSVPQGWEMLIQTFECMPLLLTVLFFGLSSSWLL